MQAERLKVQQLSSPGVMLLSGPSAWLPAAPPLLLPPLHHDTRLCKLGALWIALEVCKHL